MELKGSRTEQNLMKAFAGESQARNRYTYASAAARKEGYVQIGNIFLETAENEREHAKVFFKLLEGGTVEFTASYPAGPTGETAANLLAAAEGEKEEWGTLYPEFAQVAEDEGFKKVAARFRNIAEVESYHERRFRKLLANVEAGTAFSRSEDVRWKCNNCGYVHSGPGAPKVCPACEHPQAHFELWVEAY
ncbi:MAG TPA: rubrerythrin family protein [Thermoleophilia bacterium]|nr:rubrerythrin family protein [Thermoleophilia bacterium]